MRLFTAIALGDAAIKNILKELQPFQGAGTPIRWIAERNIHLTLKFIGEVDESLAAPIGAALQAMPALAPFSLRLRGFGKFPAGDDLHVFWAGVEENPSLCALFTAVEDALAPLGIPRDPRPFQPHVTLGRNKARFNFKSFFALLAEKSDVFLGAGTISAFQLFSSRLAPAGPFHSILKEIPLVQS
jgi:2'-5' RNA ligase